jgi:hydrogenase/urease accessory protein HupE
MIARALPGSILWLAVCAAAFAHALQPGFVDIRALGDDRYAIGWKVPRVAGAAMAISPLLPPGCGQRGPTTLTLVDGAFSAQWTTGCEGGLEGQAVTVTGLEHTSTDVLVRFAPAQAPALTLRLTPARTSARIPSAPGLLEVVKTYTLLGIDHILLGIDHLLFVLALVLLVGGGWKLVKTVTAFTIAHSITLSAAALGYVTLPGPPVEAVIALSIVYLAHELAVRDPGSPRLAERQPWLVAFPFGLLHGLGFAGALAETGLPSEEIPSALLAFNVGVEIGQLLFVLALFALAASLRRLLPHRLVSGSASRVARRAVLYTMGSLSSFWLVQRVAGFW